MSRIAALVIVVGVLIAGAFAVLRFSSHPQPVTGAAASVSQVTVAPKHPQEVYASALDAAEASLPAYDRVLALIGEKKFDAAVAMAEKVSDDLRSLALQQAYEAAGRYDDAIRIVNAELAITKESHARDTLKKRIERLKAAKKTAALPAPEPIPGT